MVVAIRVTRAMELAIRTESKNEAKNEVQIDVVQSSRSIYFVNQQKQIHDI